MENLSAVKACLDDAIALLDGLGTNEDGDFVRQAQSRIKSAMENAEALSSKLRGHGAQIGGDFDVNNDVVRYLEGAGISGASEKLKDLFIANTGRDLKGACVVRVHLASGRTLHLEAPFRLVGAFLSGETPFEDQQCGLINLSQIETIEFTW